MIRAPESSKILRFYKVFYKPFCSLQNVVLLMIFLVFGKVVTQHQLLLRNLMLFDTFWCPFAKRAPKGSINDRFYKVFLSTFLITPKHCFTKVFLMFPKVVKRLQL